MKRRVVSGFLAIIMLLSITAGLSGCGKSGFGATTVVTKKEAEIGNLKKDGWMLSIPRNAFDEDVTVSVTKVESGEAYDASQEGFLVLPINIGVEGMENVRLNEPVKITMRLSKKNLPDNESFDRTVMAYWNGSEWEPIIPDPVRLSEGYLEFETWHFSSYSGKLMDTEEQIKKYARDMAIDDLTNQTIDPTLKQKLTAVVNDYFDGLKMYDQKVREAVVMRVQNSTGLGAIFLLADHAESTAELGYKVTEMIVEATVDVCEENPLAFESFSTALGMAGDIAEASVALYDRDYQKAASELTAIGATILGYGGVGAVKSLVDLGAAVVEQGIMGWKDYELECAYKAYYGLAKENTYGYKLNTGDWETLMIQMRGYYNQLVRERKDAYKNITGKDRLTNEEEAMIERQVESDIKKKFEERAKIDHEIDARQAEYEIIIRAYKDAGLFTRAENGFKYDMTIEQRLHSLFAIREIIFDIVGGDISKFGSEKDREANIAWAIRMWLGYGKDRTKFYDWMREQGYLKKAGEETEGYWKFVRSFENKYITSAADDFYSDSWSGGAGSYTYRCKIMYDGVSYTGKTHDSCRGEFVENKGTSSAPKDSYRGGEWVEIDMKISASTSSNICFHLGASMSASITPVNKDDPFANYGTDRTLFDVTEKLTRSYIQTGKNDTNTGYYGESVTVGGEMPSGSANGDKVYILIGFSGGNNTIMTAYEYEWVKQ